MAGSKQLEVVSLMVQRFSNAAIWAVVQPELDPEEQPFKIGLS